LVYKTHEKMLSRVTLPPTLIIHDKPSISYFSGAFSPSCSQAFV
jgi:hypothetical protein